LVLYHDDETDDYLTILSIIDGYYQESGLPYAEVDSSKILAIIRMMKQDFPALGGLAAASPFKKVANFFCYFIAERPISTPFPKEVVGEKLASIPNHQNVMVAYHVAISCLNRAEIERNDKTIKLENRIKLSTHSYIDLIHACKNIMPRDHFHLVSVYFEQLAYKFNPDASYPLVV